LTGQELTDGECSGEADPTYTFLSTIRTQQYLGFHLYRALVMVAALIAARRHGSTASSPELTMAMGLKTQPSFYLLR
jgi:hypothetical protein